MKTKILTSLSVAALCLSFAGCKKHPVAAAPTPPAPVTQQPAVASRPAPAERSQPTQTAQATPERGRMPDAATRARIQELLDRIQDAYFDYDRHNIRPDAEAALKKDVETLSLIIKDYPDFKLTVEGHCDERGSDEYNLALGEARAKQAAEYMASLGLPANQLKTISYGRQRPVCNEATEECWQKNRRAHITQAQ